MTLDEWTTKLRETVESGALRAWLVKQSAILAVKAEADGKLNAGAYMRVRSGRLQASIAGAYTSKGDTLEVRLSAGGTDARGEIKYARLQELGGVVRPVNAKMLRIPLGPAMTAAGEDRYPTPLRQSAPGMFHIVKSKAGNPLLVHNETGEPWYVLKHSTRISPHYYLREAMEDTVAEAPKVLKDALQFALQAGRPPATQPGGSA